MVRRSGLLLAVFESVGHGFDPDLRHKIFTFYLVDFMCLYLCIYYRAATFDFSESRLVDFFAIMFVVSINVQRIQ